MLRFARSFSLRAGAAAACGCATASGIAHAHSSVPSNNTTGSRFAGKTVLISGAGGSFGREGALYFASEGASVIAVDLSAKALAETLSAVREANPNARCISAVCNICDEASVAIAVQQGVDAFGKIDLCWNNAGIQGPMVPAADYPLKDFQQVMDVNVVGSFKMLQAVSKAMRETGGGAIVNTASVAALRGTPTMIAYVASKAAVLGMTVSAAKDLAPYGIRVNAVSPALIGPGFMWDNQNKLHAASGSPYFSRDPETVAAAKLSGVPLKRLGSAREVVLTVAFLLSDDASYTTGANLIVSGGMA